MERQAGGAASACSWCRGANALDVADAVKTRMDELQPSFPPGVQWFVAVRQRRRSSRISIDEVVKTLVEAMVLVFLVMLLFLQNFRATLIPTLVVPVALLGTFLGMWVLGFTINQLTPVRHGAGDRHRGRRRDRRDRERRTHHDRGRPVAEAKRRARR